MVAVALFAGTLCEAGGTPQPRHFEEGDLTRYRPVELLHALKSNVDAWRQFSVETPVRNWVRDEDVAKLIPLLESKESCAPVVLAISGYWPSQSTVGAEAAFMIRGYRQGIYPPSTVAGELSAEQKKEILDGWKSRSSKPVK